MSTHPATHRTIIIWSCLVLSVVILVILLRQILSEETLQSARVVSNVVVLGAILYYGAAIRAWNRLAFVLAQSLQMLILSIAFLAHYPGLKSSDAYSMVVVSLAALVVLLLQYVRFRPVDKDLHA